MLSDGAFSHARNHICVKSQTEKNSFWGLWYWALPPWMYFRTNSSAHCAVRGTIMMNVQVEPPSPAKAMGAPPAQPLDVRWKAPSPFPVLVIHKGSESAGSQPPGPTLASAFFAPSFSTSPLTRSDPSRVAHPYNGVAESVDKRPFDQEQLPRRHQWPRPSVDVCNRRPMGALHSPGATSECFSGHSRKGEHSEG